MHRPVYKLHLRGNARTHQGHLRANNQDSVHMWTGQHSLVAAVADGMGGAAGGAEASQIAIESLHQALATHDHTSPDAYEDYEDTALGQLLVRAIIGANANIVARARLEPEMKGMGTTMTMAFIRDTSVVLGHVGDSRAYHVNRRGDVTQLTSDHTFVQALVDAGHISEDEADDHPMKNVLYRALGQGADLDVDIIEGIHLRGRDRIILCSDGLTLHVTAEEIGEVAHKESDPERITDGLLSLALARGGRDNISVIAICAERNGEDDDTQDAFFESDVLEPEDETLPMQTRTYHDASMDYDGNSYEDAANRNGHYGGGTNSGFGEGRDDPEPFL